MGELRIIDSTGDTKINFDPKNRDEVEAAEAQFDTLTEKGFTAYHVEKDGSKGKVMKKFDSKAGLIIMVPTLAGG
jgi:hypothetical protein